MTLELAELERTPPRVAVAPGPSLFALAADVAGARRGVPAKWVAAARAELDPADMAALSPIGAPPGRYTPGCATTTSPDGEMSEISDALERIATLPAETLLDDIASACGPSPAAPWDAIARQPRRWLIRYARALGRVWKTLRGPWEASAALLDREAERIATATERGSVRELISSVHAGANVRNGTWRLETTEPLTLRPAAGGTALTPVLGGPGSSRAHYADDGELIALLYPLPGAGSVLDGSILPPAAALEALIGQQRATILRLLASPRPAGSLAEAMIATPGAATHHLKALEAAGLIVRERDGRRVIVHRTARGTRLLELYRR